MITTNLTTNPGFNDGILGWAASNGTTLSTVDMDFYSLVPSLKVLKSSTAAPGVSTDALYRANVTVGSSYAASAYVKIPTGQQVGGYKISISWYNGSTLLTTISSTTALSLTDASGWARVSVVGVAPASSTKAGITIYQDTGTVTSGNFFLVDSVQFENGTAPTQFINTYTQTQENAIVHGAMAKIHSGDPVEKPYITGLKLEGDISINGLVLNAIDEEKVIWVCTDIENWWTLPSPEVPDIQRGLDDGSYDVRGRWLARTVTIKGTILPPSASKAPAAREKLIRALDMVYSGGWLLVNEGPVRSSYVRLVGALDIQHVNAKGRMDFTAQLRAGDPVKYSWDYNTSDGRTVSNIGVNAIGGTANTTTITNAGNTNVTTIFSITGPMTAPAYIKNVTTGDQIKIVKNLRAAGLSVNVASFSRTSKVSTLTTSGAHPFLVGDTVTVANVDNTSFNATTTITGATSTTVSFADPGKTITSASLTGSVVTVTATAHGFVNGDKVYISDLGYPYDGTYTITKLTDDTFTYTGVTSTAATVYDGNASKEISSTTEVTATIGTVALTNVDTLEIDTYNTAVLYRGLPDSARSALDVSIDWIKLVPGDNLIRVEKTGGTPASATIKYRSGWIG
jgi:hypothetical protein